MFYPNWSPVKENIVMHGKLNLCIVLTSTILVAFSTILRAQPGNCNLEYIATSNNGFPADIAHTRSGVLAIVWKAGWDPRSRYSVPEVQDSLYLALRSGNTWTVRSLFVGALAETAWPALTSDWDDNGLWLLLPVFDKREKRTPTLMVAVQLHAGQVVRVDTLADYSRLPTSWIQDDGLQYGIVRMPNRRMLAYWARWIEPQRVELAYFSGDSWSRPRALSPLFHEPGMSDAPSMFLDYNGVLHCGFVGISARGGWPPAGITVYYTRQCPPDTEWSEPVPVATLDFEHKPRNVRVCAGNDGKIYLFWTQEKERYTFRRDKLFFSYSDDGITWSKPTVLASNPNATLFFKMVTSGPHRLVYLCWGEYSWDHQDSTRFLYRCGRGASWNPSDTLLKLTDQTSLSAVMLGPQQKLHTVWVTNPYPERTGHPALHHIGYCVIPLAKPCTGVARVGSSRSSSPVSLRLTVRVEPSDRRVWISANSAHAGGVSLVVFNVRGQAVWRKRIRNPDNQFIRVPWDPVSPSGHPLPSGVYIVRLEAGGQVATRKVVLVR